MGFQVTPGILARPARSALRLLLTFWLLHGTLAQAGPFEPPRGEFRAVILSDVNSSYGSTEYSSSVLEAVGYTIELWKPDIVLSAGDLIAGQHHDLPESRFAEMWAAFDGYIAGPLREANIPFGFALGNHDASSLRRADGSFAFAREREAALRYWQAHDPELDFIDRGDFPFYYTFSFRGVYVLVWEASSAHIPEERLEWARRALSSPEAQGARLRLVLGHLPLYGVAEGRNRPGEVLHDGERLREILETHGVQLYISGHHHAYYPAKRGRLHLLHTGGVGPRRLLGSDLPPRTTVTVMDVEFDGAEPIIRYTTFDITGFAEVDITVLPESIDGLNGRVVRADLAD